MLIISDRLVLYDSNFTQWRDLTVSCGNVYVEDGHVHLRGETIEPVAYFSTLNLKVSYCI